MLEQLWPQGGGGGGGGAAFKIAAERITLRGKDSNGTSYVMVKPANLCHY